MIQVEQNMPPQKIVWLNGELLTPDEAIIHPLDAGFSHAVGLFETMPSFRTAGDEAEIFRLEAHIQRLTVSAEQLGMPCPQNHELADAVKAALAAAVDRDMYHNRIRLTVTPGALDLRTGSQSLEKTIMVVVEPATQYAPPYFDQGVKVTIAGPLANPLDPISGHKTLAYWQRLMTLRQAATLGAAESIWLTTTNHLSSGCVSNLFLINQDQELLTPIARGEENEGSLPSTVLPGTTRQAILDIAEQIELPVVKRMLTVNDLLDAKEVFLTNASWFILPVSSIEKKPIGEVMEDGTGTVGPITNTLRLQLLHKIQAETGAIA